MAKEVWALIINPLLNQVKGFEISQTAKKDVSEAS